MVATASLVAMRNQGLSYLQRMLFLRILPVQGFSMHSMFQSRHSSFPKRSVYITTNEKNHRNIGAFVSFQKRRNSLLASVSLPEIIEEWNYDDSSSARSASSMAARNMLIRDLNPSQVEAVTQPLEDEGGSMIITRVVAGPGSGKTKVLTTRIAHLLNEDPYGKVLAVTFTRKAAGEMKERVEKLLMDQEAAAIQSSLGKFEESLDPRGGIFQESSQRPGELDVEGSRNPKGIERVELGTFHSICAKILRYNGDMLRKLPSVLRDTSQAQPIWIQESSESGSEEDNNGEFDDANEPKMVLVQPEVTLNGQYAIVDQSEQIRILNECFKEQEIDLKNSDLKPIQILGKISTMKEMFAQNQDPFADNPNKKFGGVGPALRMARKVYYPYREKLIMNNALDFDDLILLARELLTEDQELRERLHKRWPHVLVDEYQDTSKIQMDLIKLLTSKSLFVVGDADQSIYSWRGAHVGSLQDVATEFESHGTVLTVFLKENYRSTSNIVKAAEKVISSGDSSSSSTSPSVLAQALLNSDVSEELQRKLDQETKVAPPTTSQQDDLRRAMKPKRGAGPSPRVVACEDERGEAKFVVDTILGMLANGDIASSDTVALIYRTNAQSRYLEEACVQQNLPYVIRGGAGGFYKRAEIRDCLCFLKWLYNGSDEGSMMRAMKTPSKGIGEKAYREFKEYCEIVQKHLRSYGNEGESSPTCLDILISMTNDVSAGNSTQYQPPEGAPLPQDHISKRAYNNFLKFSTKMRAIRSKAHKEPIDKLLFFIIEELELIAHLDSISKSKSEFAERKENVQELRNAAKKYDTYGPALGASKPKENDDVLGDDSALGIFLDDVALVSDIAEADQQVDDDGSKRLVANLMTIHASKGTEFDCVFVVGLEEGTLPCTPALAEGDEVLEEEKRLCYVAMTRAKTRLILSWRKEVTAFSNWSDSGPKTQKKQRSRFLNAIVSKKSQNKTTKEKPKTPATSYSGAVRSSSTRASTRRGLNRSGLTGKRLVDSRQSRAQQQQGISSRTRNKPSTQGMPVDQSGRKSTLKPSKTDLEDIRALRTSLGSSRASNPRQQSPVAAKNRQETVDPTGFFPVGNRVVHMNFGKGIVVEPPRSQSIENAKVRVQFDNGKTLDFPAMGSEILPDMGDF